MKKSIKLSALLATLMLTSTAFAANQGYTQADRLPGCEKRLRRMLETADHLRQGS